MEVSHFVLHSGASPKLLLRSFDFALPRRGRLDVVMARSHVRLSLPRSVVVFVFRFLCLLGLGLRLVQLFEEASLVLAKLPLLVLFPLTLALLLESFSSLFFAPAAFFIVFSFSDEIVQDTFAVVLDSLVLTGVHLKVLLLSLELSHLRAVVFTADTLTVLESRRVIAEHFSRVSRR